MNSHEIWKSDSWDLLYKLLRSKERRVMMMMMMMMMMMKMIAARLYIYFPYGEISNNIVCVVFSLFCLLQNAAIFIEKVRLNDRDTIFLEFFPSRNSIEIENKGFKRTWNTAKIKS